MTELADRNIRLSVPFPSPKFAALAHDVLIVDKEHKRSEVRRELSTGEGNLIVTLYGTDLKRLRVALNGTIRSILLIAKTIDMFEKN